jgi:hypothetical protein
MEFVVGDSGQSEEVTQSENWRLEEKMKWGSQGSMNSVGLKGDGWCLLEGGGAYHKGSCVHEEER